MSAILGPREHRIRPVRALEIAAVVCLVALILWVYVAKAAGADEALAVREVRSDIAEEHRALRILEAEAAELESPARLEQLVREHTDMAPVEPGRETAADAVRGLPLLAEPAAPMASAPVAAAPAQTVAAEPAEDAAPAAEAEQ